MKALCVTHVIKIQFLESDGSVQNVPIMTSVAHATMLTNTTSDTASSESTPQPVKGYLKVFFHI